MKDKVGFHQYTDESQVFGYCNNDGTEKLQMKVAECVCEFAAWMEVYCLKLNSEKTEMIWFSPSESEKYYKLFRLIRKQNPSIKICKKQKSMDISHDVKKTQIKNHKDVFYLCVK